MEKNEMTDEELDDLLERARDRIGEYEFEKNFKDDTTLRAHADLVESVLDATEEEPPGCFGLEWNGPPLRLLRRIGEGDEPVEGGLLFDLTRGLSALGWVDGACADWLELYESYAVRVWCDVRRLDPDRWGHLRSIDADVRDQLDLSPRIEAHMAQTHGMDAPSCQLVTLNTSAMVVVVPGEFWCGEEPSDEGDIDEIAMDREVSAQALSELLWGGPEGS